MTPAARWRVLFLSASVLVAMPFRSEAVTIGWGGEVSPPFQTQILGAPDGVFTGVDPALTVGRFGPAVSYSGLAALLGIPESTLAQADVIAFEGNGGHAALSGGWESSAWTFSDGTTSRIALFNEVTGALDVGSSADVALVVNGSLTGSAYDAFFGITPDPTQLVISYIMFNLPSVLSTDAAFTVTLGNRLGVGEGSPDPDAIGVVRVPEPATLALLGVAFAALGLSRKRATTTGRAQP